MEIKTKFDIEKLKTHKHTISIQPRITDEEKLFTIMNLDKIRVNRYNKERERLLKEIAERVGINIDKLKD